MDGSNFNLHFLEEMKEKRSKVSSINLQRLGHVDCTTDDIAVSYFMYIVCFISETAVTFVRYCSIVKRINHMSLDICVVSIKEKYTNFSNS